MDEDGFYMGELNGRRGLVPSNFLQPIQQSQMNEPDRSYGNNSDKYAVRSSDHKKVRKKFNTVMP